MSENHDRRRMILDVAERLLEHYGLSKTTVADIAREAAIGVGTVYLEFGSKDDIIGQVARSKHRAILEHLDAVATSDGPVTQRLRSLLGARARLFVELASCGTHAPDLVHCRCDPVQQSWREYQRAEHGIVSRLLREGAEVGELAAVSDPDRAARAVLDAYAAFAPPFRTRPNFAEFEPRVEAMHELVMRGLRP